MHLYKTRQGNILVKNRKYYRLGEEWDQLINRERLHEELSTLAIDSSEIDEAAFEHAMTMLQAPIGTQEVWAAGVTYLRSRDARMEEAQDAGGADCYQKVYEAERPELFFKALPHRIASPGEEVCIRRDSDWNVPEPELTLYINKLGNIQAYTIGNDMSSRSIEGENPLYLPQAKVYERSAALGPCLYIPASPIPTDTAIRMTIHRDKQLMFDDGTTISRMKRTLPELAGYLFRACDFRSGVFLMTGTCVVPPNEFTLQAGDVVRISIDGIGSLENTVALR